MSEPMGRQGAVTEYVADGGRMVLWTVSAGDDVLRSTVAAKSPLTGAWLSDTREGCLPYGHVSARRERTLRRTRQHAVGGNGKRYGRHTSIRRVVSASPAGMRTMLAVV